MSILQMSLSVSTPPQSLSSSRFVSGPARVFLIPKLSHLSFTPKNTIIRMGGGPRTYPGGVSKWQWKRMQAKKAKQLLKARLARERQIYEMRKRAELRAAVSELERPWEVVEQAPKLFSVSADEQVKVLADRFQKPGGFDMWSEKDGPQLFETVDGVPSARFFPKGVVHSIKPYGKIGDVPNDAVDSRNASVSDSENGREKTRSSTATRLRGGSRSQDEAEQKQLGESFGYNGGQNSRKKFGKKGNRRKLGSDNSSVPNTLDLGQSGSGGEHELKSHSNLKAYNRRPRRLRDSVQNKYSSLEVYDMSLHHDGTYGCQPDNWDQNRE